MKLIIYVLVLLVAYFTLKVAVLDGYDDVVFTRAIPYATEAVVLIRYPPAGIINFPLWLAGVKQLIYPEGLAPVFPQLFYRVKGSSEWLKGSVVELTHEGDFIGKTRLDNLQPAHTYEYSWVQEIDGIINILEFPELSRGRGKGEELFEFTTTTDAPGKFSFVFGSCMKPEFPVFSSVPGFREIVKKNPDFVLLLGDTIYIDINLNIGSSLDAYRALYRQLFGQKDTFKLTRLPLLAIMDDHEILNDWKFGKDKPYPQASQAFREFFPHHFEQDKFYFSFERNGAGFFVLDTRSYRNPFDNGGQLLPQNGDRTMLDPKQLEELLQWLKTSDHVFRFVVSSVPFSFNFKSDDCWRGYVRERQIILDFIHANEIKNVFFLTGDRHQLAGIEFEYGNTTVGTEFSVSPINQFFLPIHYFTEMTSEMIHLTGSKWTRDKTLFYEPFLFSRTVVGKVVVDTSGAAGSSVGCPDTPTVAFCAYIPGRTAKQDVKRLLCDQDAVVEHIRCAD